jgi:hypothetical protein
VEQSPEVGCSVSRSTSPCLPLPRRVEATPLGVTRPRPRDTPADRLRAAQRAREDCWGDQPRRWLDPPNHLRHFGAGGGCGGSARAALATPRRRAGRTCSMTWGSASADRSIIVSGVTSLPAADHAPRSAGRDRPRAASANRAPKPGRGFGQVLGPDSDGNGKRATAAVMRYGCRRGKSSEGVNRVAGNDPTDLCPLPLGADGTGPGRQATRRTPGRLRGAINPRPLERRKPSWW